MVPPIPGFPESHYSVNLFPQRRQYVAFHGIFAPQLAQSRPARLELPAILSTVRAINTIAMSVIKLDSKGKSKKTLMLPEVPLRRSGGNGPASANAFFTRHIQLGWR